MSKNTGNVYWAKSRKIDKTDKERRQYVIVKDNSKSVRVAKIRGFNNNTKNDVRLFELSMDKYPLTKRSGVDRKIYSRRADNHALLMLDDPDVFDKSVSFKLSSHDFHGVLEHTGILRNKKKRKF